MDRNTMAAMKLTWQRLALTAVVLLILAPLPSEGAKPKISHSRERTTEKCKDCDQSIGTALVLTRQRARALRGLANPSQRAARRRDLKQYGGCSETDGSLYAVLECTNSVRQNPDAYANDYPCYYESWRNEVLGKNLGALGLDNTLARMAQLHTDDQARINAMTHTGSDGSSLSVRADRAHYQWSSLGENVAVGFDSAKDVVMAWMCSAGHRKNLMSCTFDSIGIGAAESLAGRHYFTQNFGCSMGEVCTCDGSSPASTANAVATATGTDSATATATATATSSPYYSADRPPPDVFDVGQDAYGDPAFPEPYTPPVPYSQPAPASPEPAPPSWVTTYFAQDSGVPTRGAVPADTTSGDPYVLPTSGDRSSGGPATATATAVATAGGSSPDQYVAPEVPSRSCDGWDWDCGYVGDVWSCRRVPKCR